LNLLSYLCDNCHKQAVLISESRDDRIDVHPPGENPINTTHVFHARFMYGPGPYISRGLCRQPFTSLHKNEACPYTREKTWRPKTDWPRRHLGSPHSPSLRQPWSRGERFWPSSDTTTSAYWAHNTSMRSVRSILARGGPTHRSLSDTGMGYSLECAGFFTHHSPTFPTNDPPLST
jgi:hypothetical protein